MIRRHHTGRLSGWQEDRDRFRQEDINPMAGMANMADAMLVLAVGIMIAVVMGWKLDLKTLDGNTRIESISNDEIERVEPGVDDTDQEVLEELGTLLYDRESGTYYILEDKER